MKPPFKTYGLTHIALAVKNLKTSVEFYQNVFGAEVMYLKESWAQITTPGTKDVLVFEENKELAGKTGGGILHFGFRMADPSEIQQVLEAVQLAGGRIRDSGEFVPGSPYVFFYDPDGYEIEVWYEKTE